MRKSGLSGSSTNLSMDDRLKRILQSREKVERDFREENQKLWSIMFIDASNFAGAVWELGPDKADEVFAEYQQFVRMILHNRNPTFVDPAGGPQLIACYEMPEQALETASDIAESLIEWAPSIDPGLRVIPSIGIHLGYLVYKDGKLLQSNTANMAKRVQTQASAGQILTSEEFKDALDDKAHYMFLSVGTFDLKNIPEPQELFEARVLLEKSEASRVATGGTSMSNESEKVSHEWVMLYIDVCESTKKFWSYGDRHASRLIDEYIKLCTHTFINQKCEFQISCEGDQIFAGFKPEKADNGLAAAIQIMQTLFRRNVSVPDQQKVQAAIGLHVGEVIVQGDELVTTKDMRVGKAVQSFATADEILLTEQFADLLHEDFKKRLDEYDTLEVSGLPDDYEVLNVRWTGIQMNTTFLRQVLGTTKSAIYHS